jgi:hypothetical protein
MENLCQFRLLKIKKRKKRSSKLKMGLTPSSAPPSLRRTHLYGNLPSNKMHQKQRKKKREERKKSHFR